MDLARCRRWAKPDLASTQMFLSLLSFFGSYISYKSPDPFSMRSSGALDAGCTCPSIHAFCAHLLAATVAAEESGDAEASSPCFYKAAFPSCTKMPVPSLAGTDCL